MNIIVLGCNGYIGKNFCEYISLNFPDINLYGADANKNSSLKNQFIGNLLEKKFTEFIFRDNYYDIVFIITGIIFAESLEEYFKYNVLVTDNILSSLVGKNSKIVILQSAAQYGKGDRNFHFPVNYYGLTKEYQEQLSRYYATEFNMRIISPILFNVYGNNQPEKFIIPKLLKRIADLINSNSKIVKDINKEFYRDFIHIDDVLKILLDTGLNGLADKKYEIGTGKAIKISDILKLIVNCYNSKEYNLKIVYEDYDYKNTDIIKQVATINDNNYFYKKIEDYIIKKIM
ncbi:MAG: NAD-dependent epimerase/dehydratase family protein [Actinobacteria bacterium]|nr:NAD-dependent epimerase/dehydratase family protein [Chloroflexota bacterium]MBE3128911.1 NAD-dependent epimerase/dehydratase family protein [Actinomycetota bacterium]